MKKIKKLVLVLLLCLIAVYFQSYVKVGAIINEESITEEQNVPESVVSELVAYLDTLTLDEVLADYGGRSTLDHVLKADYHVPLESNQDSVDAYLLDEAFQEIKDTKEEFIYLILNSFDEYQQEYPTEAALIEQVRKDMPQLLLVRSYFNTWYNIEINGDTLGNKLFLNNKSTESILAIGEAFKKDPTYLKSTGTARFYLDILGPIFGYQTIGDQLEGFIHQETGVTDYSQWFQDYFAGDVIEVPSAYVELQWSVWDKLKDNLNNLLPLLTLENAENIVIASTDTLLVYSSKNNYGVGYADKVKSILYNFNHYLSTLLKTHPNDADRILKGLQIATVYDAEHNHEGISNYLAPQDSLSRFYNRMNLYTQLSSHSGAQAAGQRIEFARDYFDSEGGGTLAHEYSHVTLPLLGNVPNTDFGYRVKGDAETISSRIFGQWYDDEGVNFILFQNPVTWDTANSADRFQEPINLQEYFNGYTSLIYVLNNAIADYILSIPVSEQVGYIRQWDGVENTITTLNEMQINELNLKETADLVDNNIGIYDKSIPDGPVPTNYMGSSFYSFDSQYFVNADGEMPDRHSFSIQLFDELMSLSSYKGWAAPYLFFLKQTDVETNLEALRIVLNDSTTDFKQFRKNQLSETYEQVKKNGLKTMNYSELLENIEENKLDLRGMKRNFYREYMKLTNEFEDSIYGDTEEITFETSIKLSQPVIKIGEELSVNYSLNPSEEVSNLRVALEIPKEVQVNMNSLTVKTNDGKNVEYELVDSENNEIILLVPKISEMIIISHEMMGVNSKKEPSLIRLSILDNENQLASEEKEIEIISGGISLYIPNTIYFKQTDVAELPTDRLIKRKSEDWSIKVVDLRGKQEENQMTQWRIEGEMSTNFIGDNDITKDDLFIVYKKDENIQSLAEGNIELSIYDNVTNIPEYDYETNTWLNTETVVQWKESEGLLLQVGAKNINNLKGSYNAEMKMDLIIAP